MSNTTTSPNMNLPVPVPGVDPGVDWANNIVADMYAIDSHNHSNGQGVAITPSGLNINTDLPLANNNAITARSVRFTAQSAPLALASDLGCIYESGVDLYYNDGAGNQIRITQSGSVAGSAGTITGLPSGTASAAFGGGTFTFQSATLTPATMAVGPLVIGRNAASSKTVTLAPNAAQAANYNLTFPTALPAALSAVGCDASGNLSVIGITGTGSVVTAFGPTLVSPTINSATIGASTLNSCTMSGATVGTGIVPLGAVLATFPNLSGAYSCTATTVADVNGFVKCNGQTISDATSTMDGVVIPNINNTVFLAGSTTSGSSGGAATATLSSANLGAHTHGPGSYATSVGVTGGSASLTGTTTFGSSTHSHGFSHTHQWLFTRTSPSISSYGRTASSTGSTSITSSDTSFSGPAQSSDLSGTFVYNSSVLSGSQDWYTAGAIGAPSGSGSTASTGAASATGTVGISSTAASLTGSNSVTGTSDSTGSGTAFSILPTYITALYVMRIK